MPPVRQLVAQVERIVAAVKTYSRKGSPVAENIYSIAEIVGSSTDGIDDAINLDWFEVTGMRGRIEDDGLCHFQVTVKVGFRLDERSA